MGVGVDKTRQHERSGGVDHLRVSTAGGVQVGPDLGDPAVDDQHVRGREVTSEGGPTRTVPPVIKVRVLMMCPFATVVAGCWVTAGRLTRGRPLRRVAWVAQWV